MVEVETTHRNVAEYLGLLKAGELRALSQPLLTHSLGFNGHFHIEVAFHHQGIDAAGYLGGREELPVDVKSFFVILALDETEAFHFQCLGIVFVDGESKVDGFVGLFDFVLCQVAFGQSIPMGDGVGMFIQGKLEGVGGTFGLSEGHAEVAEGIPILLAVGFVEAFALHLVQPFFGIIHLVGIHIGHEDVH